MTQTSQKQSETSFVTTSLVPVNIPDLSITIVSMRNQIRIQCIPGVKNKISPNGLEAEIYLSLDGLLKKMTLETITVYPMDGRPSITGLGFDVIIPVNVGYHIYEVRGNQNIYGDRILQAEEV